MPPTAVLLIDLENMTGFNAKPETLSTKLDALLSQAGPDVPAIAACAGSRITAAGKKVLSDRDIKLLTVSGDKNAADNALLKEAARRARAGCRRFLIASNDGQFAQVAELGQLEIIIWQSQRPAVKYASRAANVYHVPSPRARARPAAETIPPAQAPKGPPAAKSAPRDYPPAPGTEPTPPVATRRKSPASLAALGAGILTAGVLFGAGTVLGAAAALRLLRQADVPASYQSRR
jgi:hypothetical protein